MLVSALHACLGEGKKQNQDNYAHIPFVFILMIEKIVKKNYAWCCPYCACKQVSNALCE